MLIWSTISFHKGQLHPTPHIKGKNDDRISNQIVGTYSCHLHCKGERKLDRPMGQKSTGTPVLTLLLYTAFQSHWQLKSCATSWCLAKLQQQGKMRTTPLLGLVSLQAIVMRSLGDQNTQSIKLLPALFCSPSVTVQTAVPLLSGQLWKKFEVWIRKTVDSRGSLQSLSVFWSGRGMAF